VLGDSNFLKQLYEYDKDHIADALLKKLKKYTENPKFTPEAVEKVSKVIKKRLFSCTCQSYRALLLFF
jgi:dynein heavy chain, axonemal